MAVKFSVAPAEESTTSPTWLRESRLMASLAHPYVVAIPHDAGQADNCHYLVMEFIPGG